MEVESDDKVQCAGAALECVVAVGRLVVDSDYDDGRNTKGSSDKEVAMLVKEVLMLVIVVAVLVGFTIAAIIVLVVVNDSSDSDGGGVVSGTAGCISGNDAC